MDVERICSNCDYYLFDGHCSLTKVPTEVYQTCELHELRYEPQEGKGSAEK